MQPTPPHATSPPVAPWKKNPIRKIRKKLRAAGDENFFSAITAIKIGNIYIGIAFPQAQRLLKNLLKLSTTTAQPFRLDTLPGWIQFEIQVLYVKIWATFVLIKGTAIVCNFVGWATRLAETRVAGTLNDQNVFSAAAVASTIPATIPGELGGACVWPCPGICRMCRSPAGNVEANVLCDTIVVVLNCSFWCMQLQCGMQQRLTP